jgi:hypothetical protein
MDEDDTLDVGKLKACSLQQGATGSSQREKLQVGMIRAAKGQDPSHPIAKYTYFSERSSRIRVVGRLYPCRVCLEIASRVFKSIIRTSTHISRNGLSSFPNCLGRGLSMLSTHWKTAVDLVMTA